MPRKAIAAAYVVVAGVILAVMALGEHRTFLGVNGTPAAEFVAVIPGGEELCQRGVRIPAGAGRVQFFTGDYGRPGSPFGVTVQSGAVIARGHMSEGWKPAPTVVPLNRSLPASKSGTICLRNRGARRMALAGIRGLPSDGSLAVGRRKLGARVQIAWLRPRDASWLAVADEIAPQIGRLKSDLASWWLAALMALAMTVLIAWGLRRA